MPGKVGKSTIETITALMNFTDWLTRSMKESDTSTEELADFIGCERKTIIAWRQGFRYPKLDQVVKCYMFFGYSWVQIPFDKPRELPTPF